MASNNNDSGMGAAVGLVMAGFAIMAIALFALLAFLAFIMTVVALLAWNSPLRLGKWVVTPDEARGFVGRGIIGAIGLPAFAAFCEIFLEVQINWDYLTHMMVVGYTLGSIGVEFMMADENAAQASAPVQYIPPQPQLPPATRPALPAPKEPFRFATWDDEEGR